MVVSVKALRKTLANAVSYCGYQSGVSGLIRRRGPVPPYALTALTYHRVDTNARRQDLWPGLISATPNQFRAQLEHLRRSNYRFISLAELMTAIETQQSFDQRCIHISFDDGYEDFAFNAWPIMQELDIPCSLFVATGLIKDRSQHFWWDRMHRALSFDSRRTMKTPIGKFTLPADYAKAMRALTKWLKTEQPSFIEDWLAQIESAPSDDAKSAMLSESQLVALHQQGVDVCPHSVTHPVLINLAEADVRQEIRESMQHLQELLGDIKPVFAYPGGFKNQQTVDLCRQEAYKFAFTTEFGALDVRTEEPLRLPRVSVNYGVSPYLLEAMILTAHMNSKQ